MPSHSEQLLLPYSPEQLFDIVADVKDYPRFIPWCQEARIRQSDPALIIADLSIGFGPFRESFTSHVDLDRPHQVLVRAIDGPLEHLTNQWVFTPAGDATRIEFSIDFRFRSHLLDHVAEGMFHDANTRMVHAFEVRAHEIYAGPRGASAAPT